MILGGDHSIAIGTIAGVSNYCQSQKKKLGVIWVDAHGDMNTHETTQSGNIHGMHVASLMGLGPDKLKQVGGDFVGDCETSVKDNIYIKIHER